jgi:hypothetical protein
MTLRVESVHADDLTREWDILLSTQVQAAQLERFPAGRNRSVASANLRRLQR